MGEFEIYKDKKGEFRFRLNAGNGQSILVSNGYTNKSSCIKGVESVRSNSTDNSKYELFKSKNGTLYFNLKAGNNQIIGTSEMYSSSSAMQNGINSVKINAPKASVNYLS